MNLPDSIENLTSEGTGDAFFKKIQPAMFGVNEIISGIRQKLSPEYVENFEQGLTFYKSSASSRTFIAGVISLYTELLIKDVRESSIEEKNNVISLLQQTARVITQLVDQQHDLINLLNKKNNIDATKLSYTILGYAIETIKKIHNTQS